MHWALPSLIFSRKEPGSPGTSKALDFLNFPLAVRCPHYFDGLFFSFHKVLILRKTKGCLDLGYRVKRAMWMPISSFVATVPFTSSRTVPPLPDLYLQNAYPTRSPFPYITPLWNKVLNLISRIYITSSLYWEGKLKKENGSTSRRKDFHRKELWLWGKCSEDLGQPWMANAHYSCHTCTTWPGFSRYDSSSID